MRQGCSGVVNPVHRDRPDLIQILKKKIRNMKNCQQDSQKTKLVNKNFTYLLGCMVEAGLWPYPWVGRFDIEWHKVHWLRVILRVGRADFIKRWHDLAYSIFLVQFAILHLNELWCITHLVFLLIHPSSESIVHLNGAKQIERTRF